MGQFSFETPSPEPFNGEEIYSENELKRAIGKIKEIPERFEEVVSKLSESQLDKKTEKGVWTVRQVIHHTADSHMHAFIRFKFAMTTDSPEIKPYPQSKWALLPDTMISPVENSLAILRGVHLRWGDSLDQLKIEELNRQYYHPEDQVFVKISLQVPLYIWHANYHLGFIMRTIQS